MPAKPKGNNNPIKGDVDDEIWRFVQLELAAGMSQAQIVRESLEDRYLGMSRILSRRFGNRPSIPQN